MPKANREQIGWCTCPLCDGEKAKVHQQAKSTRRKLLYYFCDECGCIQPNRPAGQSAIRKTLVLMDGSKPEPEPVVIPEPEAAPHVPEPENNLSHEPENSGSSWWNEDGELD